MRLLHTKTWEFSNIPFPEPGSYAILSHIETSNSPKYQDILLLQVERPGQPVLDDTKLATIKTMCKTAEQDGFEYCWLYYVCVDQENISEVFEASIAHYEWCRRSGACYVLIQDRGM